MVAFPVLVRRVTNSNRKGIHMFTTGKLILAAAIFSVSTVALADAETNTLLKNPYQQEVSNTVQCAPGGGCAVVFPPTTDAVTVITSVSCSVVMNQDAQIYNAYVSTLNTKFRFQVQPFPYFNDGNLFYGLSATTTFFINKGDSLRVDVLTLFANPFAMDCTISGYHS